MPNSLKSNQSNYRLISRECVSDSNEIGDRDLLDSSIRSSPARNKHVPAYLCLSWCVRISGFLLECCQWSVFDIHVYICIYIYRLLIEVVCVRCFSFTFIWRLSLPRSVINVIHELIVCMRTLELPFSND